MHAVDLQRTPYWSDYQTNEQYFGLLSFDPGEEESVCYVDGDLSEWTEEDKLLVQERYEVLRAMFYHETHDQDAYLDPPDADSPVFKDIRLMLQAATPLLTGNWQAIYTAGDPALVVQALLIIDGERWFYHGGLISDGLLNDQSDRRALDRALWDAFGQPGPAMQLALLNYFRYSSGGHPEKMLALLQDPERDDELRFSCLRYLGHYPYAPVYETLLELAEPDRELAAERREEAACTTA